jgi:hypothetical protein
LFGITDTPVADRPIVACGRRDGDASSTSAVGGAVPGRPGLGSAPGVGVVSGLVVIRDRIVTNGSRIGRASMIWPPRSQVVWGALGAIAAAWFAVWMLFFPQYVPDYFAWDAEPRYAQVFIGAGYIFRTLFFLNVARESNWIRLRWIVWGNLAFTGTLLLATFWHIDQFNWSQFTPPTAHIWVILYIFEPVVMIYLIPRGILRAQAPLSGGPIHPWFKAFLVLVTGLLLMHGLWLVLNPEFANLRWAWELNPFDARIVAAWSLGWCFWCGTMAFALDWDEIRTAARLFIVNGVALLVTVPFFYDDLTGVTKGSYIGGLVVMTVGMIGFHVLQERRRPDLSAQVAAGEPGSTT